MSNFNAIHFRWIDPLTHEVKETVALVSPSENAVNACSFVGLATRAPNQLATMLAFAKEGSAKPKLGFAPGKSAVDHIRGKAAFIPGAVPARIFGGSSLSTLGQDLLASLSLGLNASFEDSARKEEKEALSPGSVTQGGQARKLLPFLPFLVIGMAALIGIIIIFNRN